MLLWQDLLHWSNTWVLKWKSGCKSQIHDPKGLNLQWVNNAQSSQCWVHILHKKTSRFQYQYPNIALMHDQCQNTEDGTFYYRYHRGFTCCRDHLQATILPCSSYTSKHLHYWLHYVHFNSIYCYKVAEPFHCLVP